MLKGNLSSRVWLLVIWMFLGCGSGAISCPQGSWVRRESCYSRDVRTHMRRLAESCRRFDRMTSLLPGHLIPDSSRSYRLQMQAQMRKPYWGLVLWICETGPSSAVEIFEHLTVKYRFGTWNLVTWSHLSSLAAISREVKASECSEVDLHIEACIAVTSTVPWGLRACKIK